VKKVLTFVLSALLLCSALSQEASPPNKLYQQALVESGRAAKLERRGKDAEAVDTYELAGRLSEAAIQEAERTGMAAESRPPEVYFRCATSYLHAGRVLAHMKRDDQRKDEDLQKAVKYLALVDEIERDRAQRANAPLSPEIWKVRNAAGYACFLRGELAQSRQYYQAVLEMNPTYKPAEQAIAEINKLEQQQNELFTPQGRTLHKQETRKFLRGVVDTLKLVRDIVKLGL